MLKNRFELFSKKELKELTRRFEHTKIFVEKNDKFREYDFKRIKKIYFYKQFFNVRNDDSVQSSIDRSDYRNKSKV